MISSQDRTCLSVSGLLRKINGLLETQLQIEDTWIKGEISGLKKHSSGHYYFTLKDDTGAIDCAMWRTYTAYLDFPVENGMEVLALGSVNVYERSGRMSLLVKKMKLDGIGALFQEFERRRLQLEAAGYFSSAHKKPRPEEIEDIAVVTGKTAAALQDVLSTIQRRWPMARVTLYPAMVQGPQAPASLVQALKKADAGNHDAILLVRGGGSYEDLFCFNDPQLVKTLYDLNTFVVSGIGHETDTTLADFAADVRAVTPTAAAQFVTRDQFETLRFLKDIQQFYIHRMNQIMDHAWNSLAYVQNHPYLANPQNFLAAQQQSLDSLKQRLLVGFQICEKNQLQLQNAKNALCRNMDVFLHLKKQSLDQQKARLDGQLVERSILENRRQLSLYTAQLKEGIAHQLDQAISSLHMQQELLQAASPEAILEKGYAMIEQDGQLKTSIQAIDQAQALDIIMKDGRLRMAAPGSKEE